MKRPGGRAPGGGVCARPHRGRAQPAARLEVVQAAPQGEVDARPEAAEVRVVFSEPMVALGRIPATVDAPFFHIAPALPGSFRWSGTRTLVFTPADPEHLPYATRYDVTIDATATSASGATLGRPYTFSFTTPTLRLAAGHVVAARRPLRPAGRAAAPLQPARLARGRWIRTWPSPSSPTRSRRRRRPATSARPPIRPRSRPSRPRSRGRSESAAPVRARSPCVPPRTGTRRPIRPPTTCSPSRPRTCPRRKPGCAWPWAPPRAGRRAAPRRARCRSTPSSSSPRSSSRGMRCRRACDPDDYNPLVLRGRVAVRALRGDGEGRRRHRRRPIRRALAARPRRSPEAEEDEPEGEDRTTAPRASRSRTSASRLKPARTYAVTVDAATSRRRRADARLHLDGQRRELAPARVHQLRRRPRRVGEVGRARSFRSPRATSSPCRQWLAPLAASDLMPAVRALQEKSFLLSPPGAPVVRRLTPKARHHPVLRHRPRGPCSRPRAPGSCGRR